MAKFENEGIEYSQDSKFITPASDVLPLLEKVKKTGTNQYVARCPAHNDGNPSLAVKEDRDGSALLHCFAGCTYEDILRSIGLWKDTPVKEERIKAKIVAVYDYVDEAGELRYQAVRFEPKNFRQRRPDGKGGFIYNLDGIPRLLYNLPALLEPTEEYVFIVEGEKDADNLNAIGGIATTNSGGASKWDKSFNKYFANKDVVIIPDNDISGTQHAEIVSKQIYRSAKSVRIVELPSEVAKYDVSDYIDDGNTLDDLLYLCNETKPLYYSEEELTADPSQSHNLEAEQAVLGAVFKNPVLISRVIDHKLEKHYFDKTTKTVLNAMMNCFVESQDINYITVGDQLGNKVLESIGGTDYLRSLEGNLPEVFDIESWIKIIVAKSQYRDLVNIGKKLTNLAEHEAQSVKSLTDTFLDKVYDVKAEDRKKGLNKLGNNLEDVIVAARQAAGGGIVGLSTGLVDLDYMLSGLKKTDLIIVAGRPAMGKTSLAINIGTNVALKGHNVAVFSLEMSEQQLISKVLCSESYVNSFDFNNGNMQEADWARILEVLPSLDEIGLYIDDTPSLGLTELRSKALRMHAEHGLDLIIIDYLQLMSGSGYKGFNRQQEISEISRGLKALAKELNIPVVALSQLNRSPEGRAGNRPQLSDLRESGAIEQDADIVAFVYRDDYYNPDNEDLKGLAEVIIAKARNGPTGTVQLAFLAPFTKFMNLYKKW